MDCGQTSVLYAITRVGEGGGGGGGGGGAFPIIDTVGISVPNGSPFFGAVRCLSPFFSTKSI